MFDTDRFIAECREAGGASGPSGVLEVVSAAVTSPAEILQWDPERLLEEPYDVKRLLALFNESNRLHASA